MWTQPRPAIRLPTALVSAILALAGGCAPADDGGPSASAAAPLTTPRPLLADADATYYIATREDLRPCRLPQCGGVYMQRVNSGDAVCSDGTLATECRVIEFDYATLRLDPTEELRLRDLVRRGRALLRARMIATAPIDGRTYDKLVVSEAWEGRALLPPLGSYLRVRRVPPPPSCPSCPPLQGQLLNQRPTPQRFAQLRYDPARFSAALIAELDRYVESGPAGLLVAGSGRTASGQPTLDVSEAYTNASEVPLPGVGQLGDACGSRGLPATCADGLFCKHEASDSCGRTDASGVCAASPQACTAIYKPVCGCDGKTYGNACAANQAGVSVDHEGAC